MSTQYLDKRVFKPKNTSSLLNSVQEFKPSPLKELTIEIPAASIITSFTTPITLVSALGTNKGIQVVSANLSMIVGTIAYTVVGVTSVSLQVNNVVQASSTVIPYDDVANTTYSMALATTAVIINDNTSLVLKTNGANPLAGNGTLMVNVVYREIHAQ